MSNLIAYKMYLIDKMMFQKELSGIGVFRDAGRFQNGDKTIRDYYILWFNSIEPTAN